MVNTPAAEAGVSLTISERSGLPLALIPQWSPLARNPEGAVTPPSTGLRLDMYRRALVRVSANLRRHHRAIEVEHDGVLTAVAEQRTAIAVARDLLGHPRVRDDREATTHEERRLVRERTELGVALAAGPRGERLDHLLAEAKTAHVLADDERTDLGHALRQRCELSAAHHAFAGRRGFDRHDEARRMHRQLAELPGQQPSFFEMGRDQRVQRRRIRRDRSTQRNRHRGFRAASGTSLALTGRPVPSEVEGPIVYNNTHCHLYAFTSSTDNDASAPSRIEAASSISAAVTISGGSIRTTFSAVRLTNNPLFSAAATTGCASTASSSPRINPAPRTAVTTLCLRCSSINACSNFAPASRMCGFSASSSSST